MVKISAPSSRVGRTTLPRYIRTWVLHIANNLSNQVAVVGPSRRQQESYRGKTTVDLPVYCFTRMKWELNKFILCDMSAFEQEYSQVCL